MRLRWPNLEATASAAEAGSSMTKNSLVVMVVDAISLEDPQIWIVPLQKEEGARAQEHPVQGAADDASVGAR